MIQVEDSPRGIGRASHCFTWLSRVSALLSITLALTSCGGGGASDAPPVAEPRTTLAQLGEQIFHDPSLSASGMQSCATCHDAAHAFAQANPEAVAFGGAAMTLAGTRNTPSLMYLSELTAFFIDSEGTPTAGFDRDGRAKDFAEQAVRPFLTVSEMGNASTADVVGKLSRAAYSADFRALFGDRVFDQPDQAFLDARLALQAYQREDVDFAPFSSKYDWLLRGRTSLSGQELRGLALFNDPDKGNCAACHPSGRREGGALPLFTDFSYDNLGVPRNAAIPANSDPNYYDLGLCGPQRTDLSSRTDLCGAFRVPSLRNIARTAPYFHNGRFATLHDVVDFYVRRDTNPEDFYPAGGGGLTNKFDDLPAQFRVNVNTSEVPYNRQPGDEPALSPAEIDDVVAFLQTLTDGFQP